MTNHRVALAGAAFTAALWITVSGCSDDENQSVTCGQGTELKDGVCVVVGSGGSTQDASAAGSSGAVNGGSAGAGAGGSAGVANGGSSGAAAGGSAGVANGGSSGAETGGSSFDGGAGAGGCSAATDCDDGIACTVDGCSNNTCYHWVGTGCPAGQMCTTAGCVSAPICATTAQCEAQWANDPCRAKVACDAASSTCKFSVLDKDNDGHPPLVCGGDDCDDSTPSRHPGFQESCDQLDNDCDNEVDENTICNGPQGPSCGSGLDCGGVSCCENRRIPGGDFMMGRSDSETASECKTAWDCDASELPEHLVHVSGFYLDTFEVTVGRMREFVKSYTGTPPAVGAGAHPLIPGSGWSAQWNGKVLSKTNLLLVLRNDGEATWTDSPGAKENLPVNMADWYLAFQFCLWDGGRLPTEAEWEFAAAGGVENRLYPWGNATPSSTTAVYGCLFNSGSACVSADIAPVGSKPSGRGLWGQSDLAGNMEEYVLDSYLQNWYTDKGAACSDCAAVYDYIDTRGTRGGNWKGSQTSSLRAARRGWAYTDGFPYTSSNTVGFRCARD